MSRLRAEFVRELLAHPCAYCGGVSEVVDHVVPVSRGGTSLPDNLAPACRACNGSKGARDVDEWFVERFGRDRDQPFSPARIAHSRMPRLAYSPDEAAAALGCSRTFFDEHVAHELRIVRVGRRRFIAVRELDRWLDDSAARAVGR